MSAWGPEGDRRAAEAERVADVTDVAEVAEFHADQPHGHPPQLGLGGGGGAGESSGSEGPDGSGGLGTLQSDPETEFAGHTDEWYQHTRHEQQTRWYPGILPDEAPEARAERRAAYAEAVEVTSFNLSPISAGFLDPVSLQQLIPPRRGQVQGPATRLDGAGGLEAESRPTAAPRTGVSPNGRAKTGAAATSVSRASRIMAMGTIASRVTGMVRSSMMVAALSTSSLSDAFSVGNNLPNMVYMIVIGGAVNAIFVPQLVRAMKDDADGGQAFINRLLTMTIVVVGALTVLALLLAPQLVNLYTGGSYSGADRQVTIMFARYCLPQIFFYGLSVMLGQILNAKDSYGPMMWTPVLANVVQIAAFGAYLWIVGGITSTTETITSGEELLLGLGTTLGIVLQALTLVPYLRGVGVNYRPRFDWRGTGLGKSVALAKWTLATVLVTTAVSWAVTVMATTMGRRYPFQGVGYSAYSYAVTTWILPQSVVTVSIITALLPRMSRSALAGDKRAVGDSISYGLRSTGILIVPAAFAFLAFAQQIVSILFGHGSASPAQSHNLGYMLMVFSLGLIPYSAYFVMLRGFYAYQDTKTPFYLALWIGLANAALAWLSFAFLGGTQWAVAGMCAAYSVSYLIGVVITARRLHLLVGSFDGRRVVRVHVKLCAAAALAAAIGGPAGIYITDLRGAGTVGALAGLIVGGALFVAVFLGAARAMHVREMDTLLGAVKSRLGRYRRVLT
ncbi:murein biosynthesis integral membrane protein MurJ [Actinospica durhamensis]|uniref:Murein biosynthesis integral membrane protein MurJ n=1 Tax=Actinospica durhamensis TaxID=1508375 RepID=A0A941IUE6_9ACTN|nr:murein biosynthesis integral membrane protein MurJ [Actinospica durhamensis]MBR7837358.1 murein biosynthesis integral membrane protein MurJ [Actinospica durhamensis]